MREGININMYQKYVKRILDLAISIPAIVILSPLMLTLAVLVKMKMGSPVIFSQRRAGYHEKVFTIYKFRTMTDELDENGKLLPDERRLTKFGKVLRASSLDELPQLFNILRGDLSIIGPRALPESYLPEYTAEQRRRHDAMPGLVGLAALHGRNAQSWDSKFYYDLKYVDHINFVLDVKIFFGAILVVIKREGINGNGVKPFAETRDV